MSLREGGFDGALGKCRKVVGHFKTQSGQLRRAECPASLPWTSSGATRARCSNTVEFTLEMIKRVMRNRDALHTNAVSAEAQSALPTNAEYESWQS